MRSARRWLFSILVWIQPGVVLAQVRAPSAETRRAPETAVGTHEAPADASTLVARGIELRKLGDDRGALEAFSEAWRLDGSPRALAQMALAEQALGRWAEAYEHLKRALEEPRDPWIAEHGEALSKALDEIDGELGSLEVFCNVRGALVHVDGRELGRTPLAGPVKVVAGQSVVAVSAPRHFSVVRNVKVEARALSRVDIALTRIVEADKPSPPGPLPAKEPDAASSRDWLMYGSTGLAAVGVATGVTGYVIREVNLDVYNDDSRCLSEPGVRRSEACPDEAAAYRRGEVIVIAGFSAAAVFGGLSAYLWLSRPAKSTPTTTACAIGVLAVRCAGAF